MMAIDGGFNQEELQAMPFKSHVRIDERKNRQPIGSGMSQTAETLVLATVLGGLVGFALYKYYQATSAAGLGR